MLFASTSDEAEALAIAIKNVGAAKEKGPEEVAAATAKLGIACKTATGTIDTMNRKAEELDIEITKVA